jgi:hypothetical protein
MPTTMSRVTGVAIGAAYAQNSAGQAPGVIAAPANGDLVPISSGRGTLLMFRTTGTGSTVTLNSMVLSSYGTDVDITVTLAATDFQFVWIPNDGSGRFDQGGANAGLLSLNYSSVTGLTVYAVTIP